MPIGYIITLLLVGLCTALALPRPHRMNRTRYFLTVAIAEVPHLALLALLLTTLLAFAEGDLNGVTGAVLAGCAGVLMVGLAELTRRALRAAPTTDAVIRAHGAKPVRRTWARRLRPWIFPFPWRPMSVQRVGPISYGNHRRQRLDVYRSRMAAVPGPVLVYLHGGGYFSGSNRHEGRALLHHLATAAGSASAPPIDSDRRPASRTTWPTRAQCCGGRTTMPPTMAVTRAPWSCPAVRPERT